MTSVAPPSQKPFSVSDAVARIQASNSASQPSRIASPPSFASSPARQPVIVTPRPIPEIKTQEGSPQEYHTPPKSSPIRVVTSLPAALNQEEDEVVGPEAEMSAGNQAESANAQLISEMLTWFRTKKPDVFLNETQMDLYKLTEDFIIEKCRTNNRPSDECIDQFLKKAKELFAATSNRNSDLLPAFEWIKASDVNLVERLSPTLSQSRLDLYRFIEERLDSLGWFDNKLPQEKPFIANDMCELYAFGGYWNELFRLSQGCNTRGWTGGLLRNTTLTQTALWMLCCEAERRVVGAPKLDYNMLVDHTATAYDKHLPYIAAAFFS